MKNISKAAIDLIIAYEVSSKATYERKYRHPEWPGVQSGLTIGIGYDVGYATKKQLWADWEGKIPNDQIALLEKAVGKTGAAGQAITQELKNEIDVPWAPAMEVYQNTIIPRWINTLEKSLPNTDLLSDDSRGALVSLIYNRGASFGSKGERYAEMRNIKKHMLAKEFQKIPAEIRSMKRIWSGTSVSTGLSRRREDEAKLFEKGLGLKSPNTTAGLSNTTIGVGVALTAGTAGSAAAAPVDWMPYIIAGGGALVLLAIIGEVIYKVVIRKQDV